MKKALIHAETGRLCDIVAPGAEFPVHPAMRWVDAPDDVSHATHHWDGAAIVANPPPPAPTADEIAAALEAAVQGHLDATARSRRYDDIVSACSYAGAANRFQAESIAFIQWRAAVWDHCYAAFAAVQAGTRAVPTAAALIAELPVFAG